MITNLLSPSNTKTRSVNSYAKFFVTLLLVVLGSLSGMKAQCIGPYQYFESIPAGYTAPVATGLAANGWDNNVTSVTTSAANANSGIRSIVLSTTARYVQTPKLVNPGHFTFYYRATQTAWSFKVEYSPSATFASGVVLLANYSNAAVVPYTFVDLDLVALGVPANSYVRISCTAARTLFFDDLAVISNLASENTIIVPQTNNAVTCPITLAAGRVYTFYDNGGASDTYSLNQNNTLTFTPAAGEQVRLTFNSFNTNSVAADNFDIICASPSSLSNYTGTTTPPSTVYTSPSTNAPITVNFSSGATTPGTTQSFAITVESIPASPTCADPTSPTVPAGSIQANQANVTFTAPCSIPGSGYQYYFSTSATAPTSGTPPSGSGATSPMTITGLAASTTYYVWIRSNCGGSVYGNWIAVPTTFTTKCSAYPVPYTEDFNGLNGPLPTCTSSDVTGAYATNIINGNLFTATQYASFFTKPVSLTMGVVYRLSFDYGTVNGVADFDVNYGSTNFTPTTGNINVLLNNYSGVSALSTGVYNFTPSSSGTYYVGFTLQGVDTPGTTQFNLDNINIEAESCFPPTALTSSSVTATGATVSWTPPASIPANGYQYYISTSNVVPEYSTPATGFVASGNTVNLSGLTSGTTYYIWVRSDCSGRYSVWSPSGTFTTITVTVTTVTMPTGTSVNIPMNCNNIYNFFDSGGSAAQYVNFEAGTITFTPGAGKKVKVVFSSFSTESGWDGLSIYNGPNIVSPLISSGLAAGFNATTCPAGSYYGTTSPGTKISTATNGELTFRFTSDFIIVRPGWSATITCVTAPSITSFTPANNSCLPNTVVTITGTNFSGAGVPAITGVYFGGVAAASWTVNSATQITATLPAGATTGVISVTNTEAVAYSATQFSVFLPAPTTTGITICAGGTGSLSTTSVCTGFNQSTSSITGSLNAATDPVAPRPQSFTANSPICSFAGVTSNYNAIQFQVSATGLYNFEMSSTPGIDGMAYITTGAFTPGSCATGTYIIGDDDSGVGVFPLLSVNLTAGITYTLYTTVWGSSSTTATTNYTWAVTSPSGGSALLYSNAQMEWYTVATGGTAIGTGATFNPVGVAGSGLPNTNTAGTYNFYAGCSSNPNCRTLTTFIINPIPVAGTVSANQNICSGTQPSNITLTGSTGSIQWQSSPDNATWTNIPGATATPLTSAQMGTLTATRYYHAVLTTPCGNINSPVVTVTVSPVSVAGTITPPTSTVCTGTNSTLLTLTGNTGSIQWQSSPDNAAWTNISGATTGTYTTTNLTATTYYRAVVTSGSCPSANSASVVINVSPLTVAGTISPASTAVCSGTNSTLLSLSGNTGTIQWQSSPDNATWTNIGGATSATYSAVNLTSTTYYRAVVTSGGCASQNTVSVVVNVSPAGIAGTAGTSQIICPGQPADLTLTGFTGTIQWQSSPDSSTWTNISPGGTGSTLLGSTIGSLASTTYFRAVVTNGVCPPVNSNTVTVTITPAVGGTSSPASQNTCTAISNITVTGYTGTILRWEWATTSAFTTPNSIPASAFATLTAAQMGAFSGTRYYRAVISAGSCTAYSTTADVTYNVTVWSGTWSNGVPNSTTGAIFTSNYSSTGNLNACSVQVTGGTITVNAGHTWVVQNSVAVSGGTLTFNNNSSLVQVNDAAVNSGYITYRRDAQPMIQYDYTYWSSPLSPQTLVGFSPLTMADKYFYFNPTSGQYIQINANNLMDPGKGYIVRAPQNFTASQQTFTAIFNGGSNDGIPNNGIITEPIVGGSGNYNLIGNPYPSAIDADLFYAANNTLIDGNFYFWTHNTAIDPLNYTQSDYAQWNSTGGTGTAGGGTGNSNVPNGNIAAGQGFFVVGILAGSNNATFNNSMRLIGLNDRFYRTAGSASPQNIEKHRVWLEMKNNQGLYKQTLVGYVQGATNQKDLGFDGDAADGGNAIALYSVLGEGKLGIQGRALPFNANDQVPLGYSSTVAGNFEIALSNFDGLFLNEDVGIYLEDKVLNVVHDLRSGSYAFSTAVGTFDTRFVLRYTNSALGVHDPVFSEQSVIVYKNDTGLHINTSNIIMDSVKIFDARGRLILTKENINSTETVISNLFVAQEVLIVKITTDDNRVVNKKVIY